MNIQGYRPMIAKALCCDQKEITDIQTWKKGMTNRSYRFSCKGKPYILRVPGEGTDQLIDRRQEYQVYKAICNAKLCDEICYMDPETGYKITGFLEHVHSCDAENRHEVARAMRFLRNFHEMGLKVPHTFDLFEKIEFYESLWNGEPSIYEDYQEIKARVMSLKDYIEQQPREWVLTHVDANPDNFLMSKDEIYLIDWEYAGMQDPHLDIAMFAIYAMYDRQQTDRMIDLYFTEGCGREIRDKIYCYMAVAGLLWSNWCEYKRQLGVEFGAYSSCQYRYAQEYSRLFWNLYDL